MSGTPTRAVAESDVHTTTPREEPSVEPRAFTRADDDEQADKQHLRFFV